MALTKRELRELYRKRAKWYDRFLALYPSPDCAYAGIDVLPSLP